jgi:AcrR family transcriptional regulator
MNRRKLPKQKRGKQKVNMIMRTAARLFSEQGYESTTTRHIADQAGLPIGTIYQFFRNKKEILLALAEFYGIRIDEHYARIMQLDEMVNTNRRKLPEILIESFFVFDDHNPEFYSIFNFSSCTPELKEVTELLDRIAISRLGKICRLFNEEFDTNDNKLQLLSLHKLALYLFLAHKSADDKEYQKSIKDEMKEVYKFYINRLV